MADLPVYRLPSDAQIIEIEIDRSFAPLPLQTIGMNLMGETSLRINFTSASPLDIPEPPFMLDIPEPPFMLALGFTAQMFKARGVRPKAVYGGEQPSYGYEITATGTLVAGGAAALLEAVRVLRLR